MSSENTYGNFPAASTPWGGGGPSGTPASVWSSESSSYATPTRNSLDNTGIPNRMPDGSLSLRLTGNGMDGSPGNSRVSPSIPEGSQLPSGSPVTYAPGDAVGLGLGSPSPFAGTGYGLLPGISRDSLSPGALSDPLAPTLSNQQPLFPRLSFDGNGTSRVEWLPDAPASSGVQGGKSIALDQNQSFGGQDNARASAANQCEPKSSGFFSPKAESQSFGGFRDFGTSPLSQGQAGLAREGSEFESVPMSMYRQLQREHNILNEDMKKVVESGRARIASVESNNLAQSNQIDALKKSEMKGQEVIEELRSEIHGLKLSVNDLKLCAKNDDQFIGDLDRKNRDLQEKLTDKAFRLSMSEEHNVTVNAQLDEARRQFDELTVRHKQSPNSKALEQMQAETAIHFQEIARHYEKLKQEEVDKRLAVWIKERDDLLDLNKMLVSQVKGLQEDNQAATREALTARASLNNAMQGFPIQYSQKSAASPARGAQMYRIGSTDSLLYQTPVNSGSSPTIPENQVVGGGQQGATQSFEASANAVGRSLAREFINENAGQSAFRPQESQIPTQGEQPAQPRANPLGPSDGQAHTISGGHITRQPSNFLHEDRDYVRGNMSGNNGDQNNRGGPAPDPPPGGTAGGSLGAPGAPNNGGQYGNGVSQGGAPGGGGGDPPNGVVNVAFDANRSDPFNSRRAKVLPLTITDLPTPSNVDTWSLNQVVKMGNSFPEDPQSIQNHYHSIRGLLQLSDVDRMPINSRHTEFEAMMNTMLRELIDKKAEPALKMLISNLTEACFAKPGDPPPTRTRIRAEHLWYCILEQCRTSDIGECFYDLQVLMMIKPKARNGTERTHWLELEAWLNDLDTCMQRMSSPPTDENLLYTMFVKDAKLKQMEMLKLEMHEHEKTPVHERRWQDMKDRIRRVCNERRADRNIAVRRHGLETNRVNARVPGVPALEIGLGSDGMILDDNCPNTPRGDTISAAPGRMERGRSQDKRDRFGRNRSWSSPGGTKHSPSGYKYSRNHSRITPKGTRQKYRKRSPGGRAKYSKSPLRARSTRRRKGRRSSRHSSRTPSYERQSTRRSAAPAPENVDNVQPAGPVTFDGVTIPDGVCKYAYLGKRCPFMNTPGKTCQYKHDVKQEKPAVPASAPNQLAGQANQDQSKGSNSEGQGAQQRSSNSPARTSPDDY